jgi:hypothetical protein
MQYGAGARLHAVAMTVRRKFSRQAHGRIERAQRGARDDGSFAGNALRDPRLSSQPLASDLSSAAQWSIRSKRLSTLEQIAPGLGSERLPPL